MRLIPLAHPKTLATLLFSACISLNVWAESPQDTTKPAETAQLPLDALRQFADVLQQIRNAYIEETSDQELLEYAVQGMLAGLDPHSSYLNREDFSQLQESTKGEFAGLGIEVSMEDGFVKVIAPIDDSPAKKAGLKAGDLIIQLDNQPVKGLDLNQAIDRMRGKVGTSIKLKILRPGQAAPLEINIVRAIIKSRSVRSEILEPGFAYLRIAQFQQDTGEEVHKSLKQLQEEHDIKGLVLDLRNNPGGVLQAAVSVSDAFLDQKLAVYTQGRLASSKQEFATQAGDLLEQAPIVVLINGGSASASEIVAGALQDHQRGLILGTQSFGKGSVQTVRPISEDKAIKLTTARYYTPKGRSIQAQGIVPDILVPLATVTPIDVPARTSEADLNGHLENTQDNDKVADNKTPPKQRDFSQDNQLVEAMRLLKGLSILQHRTL